MKNLCKDCYFLLVFLVLPAVASAQSVSLGADFVSRYVWRGTDFGESVSVQPSLSVSGGGFEIGSWASYSAGASGSFANEHDLWIGYSVETAQAGTVGFGITDYYFPSPKAEGFFNFDGGGNGAHFLELYMSYSAPVSFPVTLYAAVMTHNDPDNSLYLEGSLPVTVGGTSMGVTLGMAVGQSEFYGVESASVINMGLSAEKELKITDDFSLPLSVAYILNPTHERSFLVFGFSLGI